MTETPLELSIENLQALNRLNDSSIPMSQNILILGAGELGLCVLQGLASHPKRHHQRITVLIRQATLDSAAPEKRKLIQHIQSLNAGTEAGDVADASVEDLAAIFSRYDVIVSCTGMALPADVQFKILDAVMASGVKRFFPWQFGMDYDAIGKGTSQDLFDKQIDVRDKLRAQKEVDWTIVSTGLFMSFLFRADFGVVDLSQKIVRGLGSWETEITLTTPPDIGRVTAELILDPRGIGSRPVYIAGDTFTYGRLADLLDAHFETKFKRELWNFEILAKQAEDEPDNKMIKYRYSFAQGRGVAWPKEGTFNVERGIELTDVKTYLEKMDFKIGE
ncbi:hypothetical protein FVEN_g11684 [Fusarium venenatum]|uniref:NmrA-like domain-containing protein n=1 Tax=Fusarium venenatum TaxID=56646 RepID=A0A2L2TDS1_9HYPO|nr:uncharacterized protein FVRRES_11198 [Fusarium venenatum]KAG8350100.1 hypothetical protein FVEN_g11684 [Fusarium venenatum]KAH6977917.1 hypothetical protein EDB82DRAFT_502896 [Fusarium venenatum]CEI38507.1 unnamed protein product [Fusarium venenatum]